jgi:hypothetical protein
LSWPQVSREQNRTVGGDGDHPDTPAATERSF